MSALLTSILNGPLEAFLGEAGAATSPLASATAGAAAAIDTEHLVAALPIGAALVVAARTMLGVRTIGVFAPVLLALGVLGIGITRGIVVVLVGIGVGVGASPLVQRLALPRVARLGLLLCVVCGAVQMIGASADERATLPLLTIAVLAERSWESIEVGGFRAGSKVALSTGLLSIAVAALLAAPPVVTLVSTRPGAGILVGAAAIVLAGSYRGLRIGELRRFRALIDGAKA